MTNIKITDLTAYTDAASTDVLPIVDVVADVTKKIAIGDIVKAVPQGTAALPGLAFDNDPNTGVYSPGADQVAISTNGTGRLFVDAIGTITAKGSLGDIAFGSGASISFTRNDANYITAASGAGAYLNYEAGSTHVWRTGSPTLTERLRITSDGKLGLGTSSPSGRLSVQGDGTSARTVEIVNPSATNGAHLYLGDSQADASIRTVPVSGVGTNLAFYVNSSSTERMRIDNLGRVGIGTTSPAYQCVVEGSTPYLQLKQAGTNTGSSRVIFGDADTASPGQIIYDHSNSSLQAVVNGTERARIDTDGRLLLGTSSDSGGALLQVNGNRVRIATAKTPASASDTGTAGEICWDSSYIYVCTATDTWKRAALSTW
jgi:hypothetical protein